MITSDRLEAFLVFCEELNFTRAARRLAISQPSLHAKIANLADEIGVDLYTRIGRSLVLTEAGTRVRAFGGELAGRSQDFLADLLGEGDRAPVALAAGEGAFLYLLGSAVERFSRKRPGGLRLLTRDRPGTLEAVRSGEAQLGVTTLGETPRELECELVADVEPVVALPAKHRLARRRKLRIRDLAGEALILPPPGRPHRETIAAVLRAEGTPWRLAVEANGWELMLHFAVRGLGLAVVNGCCKMPRGLVARPIADLPGVSYYLVTRPGGALFGSALELRDMILGTAR